MSPEQARGLAVDKRADIWAFGVCLFESLGGERVFEGEDASITLASVLKSDPDWERLPDSTPRKLRGLLRRCLSKDPRQRLHDIADARIEIEEVLAAPLEESESPIAATEKHRLVPWVLTASIASAAMAGVLVWVILQPLGSAPAVVRSVVSAAPSLPPYTAPPTDDVTITPDGGSIIYGVRVDNDRQIYLRPVDRLEGTALTGTGIAVSPFVSPDGGWVGFYDLQAQALKKVSILGGPSITITELPRFLQGASWGEDGSIIFAVQNGTSLFRVAAAGGETQSVTTVDAERGETAHLWPEVLPGGEAVLFTIVKGAEFEIALLSLTTGEWNTLLPNGSQARYATPGYVVYGVEGTLQAVAFDLGRLAVTASPVPVLEGVLTKSQGAVNFALAQNGSLVYVAGRAQEVARNLVWVDRDGREEAIEAPLRPYLYPRISPDGERVVIDMEDEGDDIWIWEFARQTLTRLTFDPAADTYPVWTPDGRRIVFESRRAPAGLYSRAADGTGGVELLVEDQQRLSPQSMTHDGKWLIGRRTVEGRGHDLMAVGMDGGTESRVLIGSDFNERNGEISPDGRWLAYQSNESGRYEIYVRPFPAVEEGRWQISTDGGFAPLWSRDGSELFYRFGAGAVLTVRVDTNDGFRPGSPEQLIQLPYSNSGVGRNYDVSPDGQRFLMITQAGNAERSEGNEVVLVQNWFEELKRLVPTD
jgi:serine/threonine-protein kinase